LRLEDKGQSRRSQEGQNSLPIGFFGLRQNTFALGLGLPFGQIESSRLAGLCRAAQAAGIAEIRLAPGRAILLLGPEQTACLELHRMAPRYGFITDSGDVRLGIAACPGSPACSSGCLPARSVGEQFATLAGYLLDGSLSVHVSGCPKGCAHPGVADFTLIGHPDGVGLVIGGRASDMSELRLDPAEIRRGFARLAGLYREARRPGEKAHSFLMRLGASRIAAAFQGRP
jgi:precorrin-3B synthase